MQSHRLKRRPESRRLSDWVRLAVPLLVIAAFGLIAWKAGYFKLKSSATLDAVADRAREVPWLGPVFTGVYGVVAAFAAPVSPLAYGAGALFGIVRGMIAVWIGSMIGAVAGYWLARRIFADATKRLLGRHEAKLGDIRTRRAFVLTLRTQLLPVVPFGVFNYAAGAAKIPFGAYLAATAIGILPGTIAAVVVGERLAAGIRGSGRGAFVVAGAVIAALLAISFAPSLIRRRRQRR
jgi:uncharacterized membrane protein YdjX (TVP38/TMEM64 family)